MNDSRFDDLTKALASSTSRRQALKIIAATTLGGMLRAYPKTLGSIVGAALVAACRN